MLTSKDDSVPAPKIAIKGFSLSSKSSSKASAKPPAPKPTLGKRPRSTFDREESESGDERVRHEVVTGFGSEGAIRREEKKKAKPLVIPRLENRWKGTRDSGKNLLPPEVQAANRAREEARRNGGVGKEENDILNGGEGEPIWGLNVKKRTKTDVEVEHNGDVEVAEEQKTAVEEPLKERSADEEALDALLGDDPKKKGSALVIPITAENSNGPRISEEDAYRKAVREAPDVATLEDYEAVPVEEFGAALLRGMGWKGEDDKGEKKMEVKKRQNLLGLGAKELLDAEELGAWVQKSNPQRLKSAASGDRRPERKPTASDYKRERERKDEQRRERGGGGYRERERESDRDRDRYRDRERERDRDHGRDRYREKDYDRRR